MSQYAAFASTPTTTVAQISAANTNRDGTGTIVAIGSAAPAAGERIDEVTICATGATTAGVVRLYWHNGSNARLIREVLVEAKTPSTSVEAWSAKLTGLAWVLPSGYTLYASTHNAETFNVFKTNAGALT